MRFFCSTFVVATWAVWVAWGTAGVSLRDANAVITEATEDHQVDHSLQSSGLRNSQSEPRLYPRCSDNGCFPLHLGAKFKHNGGKQAGDSQQVSSRRGRYPSSREGDFTGMSSMSGDTGPDTHGGPLPAPRPPVIPEEKGIRYSSRLAELVNKVVQPLRVLSKGKRSSTPPSSDFVRRSQTPHVSSALNQAKLPQRGGTTSSTQSSHFPRQERSDSATRLSKADNFATELSSGPQNSRPNRAKHLQLTSGHELLLQKRSKVGSIWPTTRDSPGIIERRAKCGGKGCFPNLFKSFRQRQRPSSPPNVLPNLPVPDDNLPSLRQNAMTNADRTSALAPTNMPLPPGKRASKHAPNIALSTTDRSSSGRRSFSELSKHSKVQVKITYPRWNEMDFPRELFKGQHKGEGVLRYHSDPILLYSDFWGKIDVFAQQHPENKGGLDFYLKKDAESVSGVREAE